MVPPLGGWCLPSARPSSRLAAALPSWACRLGGAGPLPPRAFGAGCRLRRVFRLLSAFLLVFCVLRLLLFAVWGGFFRGWGGFFGCWVCGVVFLFFVDDLRLFYYSPTSSVLLQKARPWPFVSGTQCKVK